MKKVSIQDIAKSMNLSRNTISKALNNDKSVAYKTRQKIIKKASEMGYKKFTPELLAIMEKMNPNRTGNIAVIASKDFSDFWHRIVVGISDELSKNKYNLLYSAVGEEEEEKLILPDNITSYSVDGIICISVFKQPYIDKLVETKLPVVFLDTSIEGYNLGLNGDVVLVEGESCVYRITKDLIRRGCKDIGFIGDITYCRTIFDRWCGFRNALTDSGIVLNEEICFTKHKPMRYYNYEEVSGVLDKIASFPKAFVCANDNIASVVVSYLKGKGYKIPEDIAVTGFDDAKEGMFVEPRLTTVHVHIEYVGKRLGKLLLSRIKDPQHIYEKVIVASEVSFRESSNILC